MVHTPQIPYKAVGYSKVPITKKNQYTVQYKFNPVERTCPNPTAPLDSHQHC